MADSTEFKPERGAQIAAVGAIAAAYFYFLIFTEFAFLELARPAAGTPARLRLLMTLLGLGGIAGSLLAAARFRLDRFPGAIANAFRACSAAAAIALLAKVWIALLLAAALVGLSLGWLTVSLCAGLRATVGTPRLGLVAGLGTGLAYAACNLPPVFNASPYVQAVIAAFVAGIGSLAGSWLRPQEPSVSVQPEYKGGGLAAWIAILMALVWMDSAAFYIIQHTPALRGVTWGGGNLVVNALTHLAVAVLAGFALDRGWSGRTALAAFALLAAACGLLDATRGGFLQPGALYVAGVSLYSVVLLYYPARGGRAWPAAVIFAIAGWFGSAMGIGMAQDLQRVPPAFLLAAGGVVVGGLAWRHRLMRTAILAAAVAVFLTVMAGVPDAGAETPEALIARGREVYVREGCIHCHSQYVRPGSADVERWGPARSLDAVLAETPPLVGNRRQGPDLATIGARRSAEWNREHLIAPRAVSPGSRMPSYAYLFSSHSAEASPGEALVAYLGSLGAEATAARARAAHGWTPAAAPIRPAEAARRFEARCASCHGASGRGDGPLAGRWSVAPPDFSRDPWRRLPAEGADPMVEVARIIKFGLPGSPMAGHEDLTDGEVAGLARHVLALHGRG